MQKFENQFFSNAIKSLKIPEYLEVELLANNISHPIFKAIMNFRNHPSINAIKNPSKGTRSDLSVQDVC